MVFVSKKTVNIITCINQVELGPWAYEWTACSLCLLQNDLKTFNIFITRITFNDGEVKLLKNIIITPAQL